MFWEGRRRSRWCWGGRSEGEEEEEGGGRGGLGVFLEERRGSVWAGVAVFGCGGFVWGERGWWFWGVVVVVFWGGMVVVFGW